MSSMKEIHEEKAELVERQRELEEEALETLSHRPLRFALKLAAISIFGRKQAAEESDETATA